MSDINVKTWVRTNNLYGQHFSIDELDYANGLYLAHTEEHPNGTNPFETVIISSDLEHWQHRTSSPEFTHSFKNVRITGTTNKFVCVATTNKDTGTHLDVLTSENGFDWTEVYASEVDINSYCSIAKSMAGGVVAACHGKLIYSSNLTDWAESKFTGKYINYTAIDIAYLHTDFYAILRDNDSYAIAYTKDLKEFKYYDLEWGKSKPTSMEASGEQLVITCSDGLAERVSIYYTSDGKKNEWSRFEFKPPFRTISNSVSELLSCCFHHTEWVLVGRVREYNNSRSMLFSYKPILLRLEGKITPDSKFIQDEIDSTDLTYVQVLNSKLTCYGKSHPVGDNCLFILE
jgi:hypothetical protein